MDIARNDIVTIGQFDADELKCLREDKIALKLIESGRIGLNYVSRDKGTILITIGDKKAFKIASEIAR